MADLRGDASVITRHMADVLVALGERLLQEPGVQRKLNGWWLDLARKLVVRFQHQVSGLIADVVKSWDAVEVSRKVELEIGKDLQFIRINGTFVGGVAGLLLYGGIRIFS